MSCVAVTGGAGFVGVRLIERLLADGHRVRALQHRQRLTPRPGLEIIAGTLADPDRLQAFLTGANAVIHASGLIAARTPAAFFRVNAEGTAVLAQATARVGIERFLLVSSLAARAPQLSPYAASKRAAEAAVQATGLAWDIVRPPAVYGPGDRQTLLLFQAVSRRIGLLPSGRSARASLIHVDDLAGAMAAWFTAAAPMRGCFEIADNADGHSWPEIMRTAGMVLARKPVLITPPGWLLTSLALLGEGASLVTGRVPFLTRAKLRELRHQDWVCHGPRFMANAVWQPERTLLEGMRQTVAWYRAAGWLRP